MNDRDNEKLLGLIKEGQRILGEEEKAKRIKAQAEHLNNRRQWHSLYWAARRALPDEIGKYLVPPEGVKYGQQCIAHTISNYYQWQIEIKPLVTIGVRFGDSGQPEKYTVPLAEPTFIGMSRETDQDFTGGHALERALAFAVTQTQALEKIEAERERQEQEYEEREALASKEPKYEPVDGSEPLPDLVLVAGVRRMIQEELKKAGVLS